MQGEKCSKKKSVIKQTENELKQNSSQRSFQFFQGSVFSPYCWLPRYVFILFHFIFKTCLFCLYCIPKQCEPHPPPLCKRYKGLSQLLKKESQFQKAQCSIYDECFLSFFHIILQTCKLVSRCVESYPNCLQTLIILGII